MMKYFITGGAGFIGRNLAKFLLMNGNKVVIYDNFSTGDPSILDYKTNPLRSLHTYADNLEIIRGDILTILSGDIENVDVVIHCAAHADVRNKERDFDVDIKQNTVGTQRVLDAASLAEVKKFVFLSTGSVYGDATMPAKEDAPIPNQTSLYGASKMAGESFVQAYSEYTDMKMYVFRLVSVLGKYYSHGHVVDFWQSLKKNPEKLKVLGNGYQKKSYIDVSDVVSAIMVGLLQENKINTFNVGNNSAITVRESIDVICRSMNVHPEIEYGMEEQGWIGDIPYIQLDSSRIRELGWMPKVGIKSSIINTIAWLEKKERKAKR